MKKSLNLIIHSDVNRNKGCHSCESRNPEKHWIPGQARNDRPRKAYAIICMGLILGLVLISTLAFGENLALKATWTPNTDEATIGYKLYRTDGTRTLIGTIPGKTIAQYPFNISVPDGSIGALSFVLTGYSETKESGDSNTASYPFDLSPIPAVPGGLGIEKQ
jgi:hypothetical protein